MNRSRCALALIVLLIPSLALAADESLADIGQLLRSGKAKEAREAATRVRDTYVSEGNRSGEAAAWLLLAMTDVTLDDAEAARNDLQNASSKFTSLGDAFGAWMSMVMLAYIEMADENYDEAIAIHERTLAFLRDAAAPTTHFSLDSVKILGNVFGMQTGGVGSIGDYPELLKPFLLRFAEAISRDAYAAVLLEAGDIEKAEKELDAATAAAGMFGNMLDGTIEVHRATLRLRQWRLDDARESYLKALRGARTIPALWIGTDLIEVEVMRKLANLEVLSGRTDDGLQWIDRALERVRAATNTKTEADLLQERGSLLQNGGRFDAAIAAYEEAIKFATKNNDVARVAAVHADLGALHMFQGSYGKALEHLEKSIELFQTVDRPYHEAPVWTLLAEVHLLLESHEAAQHALDKSRALAKKSGFKLAESMVDMVSASRDFMTGRKTISEADAAIRAWFDMPGAKGLMFSKDAQRLISQSLHVNSPAAHFPPEALPSTAGVPFFQSMTMILRGKAALERGDYAQARDFWNQSLALNPNGDHRAGLLALIGTAYWREGKADDAVRFFRKAADALDVVATDVKVEELLASYLGSNRRWYFAILIDMLVKEGQSREAFAHAERARARAFLQLVGNHRFNAERGADPQLVREAETLRTHIIEREREAGEARGENAKRIQADLERERQRYRTVLTRVKVSNPEYATLTNVEPVEIDTVQKELPADATMISYFVTSHAVHAWTISRTSARHAALPLPPENLQRIVCWASRFGPREDARGVVRHGTPCNDAATAEESYQALIAPLVSGIQTERLIFVPHGALHYVPFAALRNPENRRYLIEDYTLTYAPSASALPFLRAKETAITGGTLILGDPASPLAGLKKLPFAKEEASGIAKALGTTASIGADAREALLYRAGGKVDLIHLAAHGLYDSTNPLFSRIALAPGDSHDGSLAVHEILSSVDLTGVNLVVLSACVSGVGTRSGGDEVVGLTRALLYAGTPGVISTLWNIDDAASAGLMEAFYSRLADGEGVAAALRQAQLEVMRSEQHGDPRYWAAFVLTGDPQARWKPAS